MCDQHSASHSQTKFSEKDVGGERNYLECADEVSTYDKVHNFENHQGKKRALYPHYNCLNGWVSGKCKEGHRIAKAIYCDKEWCPECGDNGSMIHRRRIARWKPKVDQMKWINYLVISPPEVVWPFLKDKKELSAFRLYIKRKLQGMGYGRGLSRWHFAGDCKNCKTWKKKGCVECDYTGMENKWYPHLNIILDTKYIPKIYMEALKRDCRRWFIRRYSVDLPHNVIVHSSGYTNKDGKKNHILRYVTRATWRYVNSIEEVETIHGFRNCNSWGTYEKPDEYTTQLEQLESGGCPHCDGVIEWDRFQTCKDFYYQSKYISTHLEGGYYQIDLPPPPPRPPKPEIHPFKLITNEQIEYQQYLAQQERDNYVL